MIKFSDKVYVHPKSSQLGDITAGDYCSFWPCSSVRGDFAPITIGKYTSIQEACVLHTAPETPMTIGDNVTIGHGAVLHGCTIESNCLIGMHATVLDNVVIGEGSIVAAGALVREGTIVPPGSLVIGMPAKARPGSDIQRSMIKYGTISYAALVKNYLEGKDTISKEELTKRMAELEKEIFPEE
jgi:carbonic anhydrase/acetyltransferase-like protein (isoleucine patch superfamily)